MESSTPRSSAPVSAESARPTGVLDTVYALAAASARTAVELTLRGPEIVRGLANAAQSVTADISPLVGDALRALPRVAVVLEALLPLARDLQDSLDRLATAAPDLHALAGAVPALQQLGGAAEDIHALAEAVPALQQLGEAREDIHALAAAVPALRQLGDAADDISALREAVPALVQLGAATTDIRALTEAVEPLTRLAAAVDDLERLAAATTDVSTIADAVGTVERIAAAVGTVEQIAAAIPTIERIAGAIPEVEKMTGAIEYVEVLARHADSTFPDMPPRLRELDSSLSVAAAELVKVTPDLRTVAGRIEELDGQIKVLADALAPLQGTTERLGRLVDRLPQTRRQRAVEG
jgi:DNA repair ATPase RecN